MPNAYKDGVIRNLWDSYNQQIDKTAIPDYETFRTKFDTPTFRRNAFSYFGSQLGVPDSYAWESYLKGEDYTPEGFDAMWALPELGSQVLAGLVGETPAMVTGAVRGAIPDEREPEFLREMQQGFEQFAEGVRMDPVGVRALGEFGMDAYEAAGSIGQSLAIYVPTFAASFAVTKNPKVSQYVAAGINSAIYFGSTYQAFLDEVRDEGVAQGLEGEKLDALINSMKDEARAYAGAEAGPELLFGLILPKMVGSFGAEPAAKVVNSLIAPLVAKNVGRGVAYSIGKAVTGGVIAEGSTEAITGYLQNEIRRQSDLLSYDPDSAHAAWRAFRIGAMAGAGMGAPIGGVKAIQLARAIRTRDAASVREKTLTFQQELKDKGEDWKERGSALTKQDHLTLMGARVGDTMYKSTDEPTNTAKGYQLPPSKLWRIVEKAPHDKNLVTIMNGETGQTEQAKLGDLTFTDGEVAHTDWTFKQDLYEHYKSGWTKGTMFKKQFYGMSKAQVHLALKQLSSSLVDVTSKMYEETTGRPRQTLWSGFSFFSIQGKPTTEMFKADQAMMKEVEGTEGRGELPADQVRFGNAWLGDSTFEGENVWKAIDRRLTENGISLAQVLQMDEMERQNYVMTQVMGVETKLQDYSISDEGENIEAYYSPFNTSIHVTPYRSILLGGTLAHEMTHAVDMLIATTTKNLYWGLETGHDYLIAKNLETRLKNEGALAELGIDMSNPKVETETRSILNYVFDPIKPFQAAEVRRLGISLWMMDGKARQIVEEVWPELAKILEEQKLDIVRELFLPGKIGGVNYLFHTNEKASQQPIHGDDLFHLRPIKDSNFQSVLGSVYFPRHMNVIMRLFDGSGLDTALNEIAHAIYEFNGNYELSGEMGLPVEGETAGERWTSSHEAFAESLVSFVTRGKYPVNKEWAKDMRVLGQFIARAVKQGAANIVDLDQAHMDAFNTMLGLEVASSDGVDENTPVDVMMEMAEKKGGKPPRGADEQRRWYQSLADGLITGHRELSRGWEKLATEMRNWASTFDEVLAQWTGTAHFINDWLAKKVYNVGGKEIHGRALIARFVDDDNRWDGFLAGKAAGEELTEQERARVRETEVYKELQPIREFVHKLFRQTELDLKQRGIIRKGFFEWQADWARTRANKALRAGNKEVAENFNKLATDLESDKYHFAPIPLTWLMKKMEGDSRIYGHFLKWRVAHERETLTVDALFRSMEEMDENGQAMDVEEGKKKKKSRVLVSPDDINIAEMILDYGRRVAHDIALSNVLIAAEEEGVIKKLRYKEDVPESEPVGDFTYYWTKSPITAPMLKGYAVETTFAKWLETGLKIYSYDESFIPSFVTRGFAMMKMWQFTNFLIMPFYNVIQILSVTGPSGLVEMPLYLWQAAHDSGWNFLFGRNMQAAMKGYAIKTEQVQLAKMAGYAGSPDPSPLRDTEAERRSLGYDSVWRGTLAKVLNRKAGENSPGDIGRAAFNALVGLPYQIAWNLNWKLDALTKLAFHMKLMDDGYTNEEAAFVASSALGAYNHVNPKFRRWANFVFFVPTFKVAMTKLNLQMMKASFKSIFNVVLPEGKKLTLDHMDEVLAKAAPMKGLMFLAYSIGITMAIDAYMRAMLGFDQDEDQWGYKYTKDIVEEGRQKELVNIVSTPTNLWLRHAYRVMTNFKGTNPVGDWLVSETYTLHPVWQRAHELITNQRPDGRYVYDPWDLSPQVAGVGLGQSLDILSWLLNETVPMYQELFPTTFGQPDDVTIKYWKDDLISLYGPVLGHLHSIATDRLTISYERERLPVRMKAELDGLTKSLYSYLYRSKEKEEWSPEKQKSAILKYREEIDALRKQLREYYGR